MDPDLIEEFLAEEKTQSRTSRLAFRCALYLQLESDEEEDALVEKISNLYEDLNVKEIDSREMQDLVEAIETEDAKLRKFLAAQTVSVAELLYGRRNFSSMAKSAVLACLFAKRNNSDLTFFINQKALKRGKEEARTLLHEKKKSIDAAYFGEKESEEPRKNASNNEAEEVLSKIRTLLQ